MQYTVIIQRYLPDRVCLKFNIFLDILQLNIYIYIEKKKRKKSMENVEY